MDDRITEHISTLRFPLLGAILGGVGYGVASTLFFICTFLLSKLGRGRLRLESRDTFLLGFCTTVWMCITFTFVFSIINLWKFLLNPEARPGYLINSIGYPGILATIINNWMVDGLLVWRAVMILKNNGFPHVILSAILVLFLLASIGLGCSMLTVASALFTRSLVMAELYTTIGLNISVTLIISVYLYIHQRRIIGIMGNDPSPITKIISMLAESAALIVAFDLFFIIPFAQAQDSEDFSNLPLQLLAYVQAIGAFLTIFRVAKGKAWANDDPDSSEACRDSFAVNSKVSTAQVN